MRRLGFRYGSQVTNAIEADQLVKVYRARRGAPQVRALDGVSLAVPAGTVLGLLGPNGAGKTTTVRILATLLRPDGGRATVGGFDVVSQSTEVRRIIGLSGQYAAVDENLTGWENLYMFGRLYELPKAETKARADELLEQFRLTDAGKRIVKTYSGGMRRRLDLAGALIGRPQLLFLDEPTTGLDPRSRLAMWDVIRGLVRDGATLLLTTQYLEEADELADKIAVVDNGKIIAQGTADELKTQVGGEHIEAILTDGARLSEAAALLQPASTGQVEFDRRTRRINAPTSGGSRALLAAAKTLDDQGIEVEDIALRRPSLDDVFLKLTGHRAEAAPVEEGDDDA